MHASKSMPSFMDYDFKRVLAVFKTYKRKPSTPQKY